MMKYKKTLFDDYTENKEFNTYWTRICKCCLLKSNISKKLLDELGSGICGVYGCENEANFYIDFDKSKVIITS